MVFSPSAERTNPISQTTIPPSAMSEAANQPSTSETRRTATTKASTTALLDGERLVDQLLSAGHFLGDLVVCAFLCKHNPRVVFGAGELNDLHVVLLEGLDHLVVEPLRFFREVVLRLLA